MKTLKTKINELPQDLLKEINELIREKYGLEEAEATGLKLKHTNRRGCPPGKEYYCWTDLNGKTRCRCI